MAAVSTIVAGAALAGGAISASKQSSAAKKAANAQVQAAEDANEVNREIYYDQRRLLEPSISAGSLARARQMLMMGYSPEEVQSYLRATDASLQSPYGATATTPSGSSGPPPAPSGMSDLQALAPNNIAAWTQEYQAWLNGGGSGSPPPMPQNSGQAGAENDYGWVDDWEWAPQSPSYQWRFDQGQKAVERSAAASGDLFSGRTGIALQEYGQGAASQEFENDFRRFGQLAGDGSEATGTVVQVAGNYGQQAGQNLRAAGDARASGYTASGNQWANFWGNTVPGVVGYGAGQGWFGK